MKRAAPGAAAAAAAHGWITARAVAKATAGEVVQPGADSRRGSASGVGTDTREDLDDRLFVALRGPNHDAHAYLGQAIERGAVGLLVARDAVKDLDLAALSRTHRVAGRRQPFVVAVEDTSVALLDLAREHRRRHRAVVVGITGSCGKTSVKEWLGAVVGDAMPTVRSPGSYNNHVGVPLTLFQLRAETRAAIVEIGTNAPGEIAQLTDVARPDIGVVTCVAPAHLEGLGSLAGVAREKSELPRGLQPGGLCVLNGDDASCRAMADLTDADVEFVSVHRNTDWFATDISFHALGTTFRLRGERLVTLPRLGTHNVYNALSVIAVANRLGVAEDRVLQLLAAVPSAARRLEPKCVGGVTIFDDTYNMNPESARTALQAVAGCGAGGSGRGFVVFGGMLELGDDSVRLHRELGEQVVQSGQDRLLCVGRDAEAIAEGARCAGMPADAVAVVADIGDAFRLLANELGDGDRVLCKASRRVALDRLVDRLVAELGSRDGDGAAAAEGHGG